MNSNPKPEDSSIPISSCCCFTPKAFLSMGRDRRFMNELRRTRISLTWSLIRKNNNPQVIIQLSILSWEREDANRDLMLSEWYVYILWFGKHFSFASSLPNFEISNRTSNEKPVTRECVCEPNRDQCECVGVKFFVFFFDLRSRLTFKLKNFNFTSIWHSYTNFEHCTSVTHWIRKHQYTEIVAFSSFSLKFLTKIRSFWWFSFLFTSEANDSATQPPPSAKSNKLTFVLPHTHTRKIPIGIGYSLSQNIFTRFRPIRSEIKFSGQNCILKVCKCEQLNIFRRCQRCRFSWQVDNVIYVIYEDNVSEQIRQRSWE